MEVLEEEVLEEQVLVVPYQGKGIYRAAVQAAANLFPKGVYVRKGESSMYLQNSLQKMDTYKEFGEKDDFDKILVIKPNGKGD